MTDQSNTDRGSARPVDRDPSSRPAETTTAEDRPVVHAEGGLLSDDDRGAYQRRWDDIQVRFVDEPQQSVREADDLVSEVTQRIAERFRADRESLEQRWENGEEPTTEELRRSVQRYRDFFQRLVADDA